jgi:hypothetical protein
MGITVDSLPVFAGRASIANVYTNIRDMQATKLSDGSYEYSYVAYYDNIKSEGAIFTQATAPTTSIWETCYTHLKEKLTESGITFVDTM